MLCASFPIEICTLFLSFFVSCYHNILYHFNNRYIDGLAQDSSKSYDFIMVLPIDIFLNLTLSFPSRVSRTLDPRCQCALITKTCSASEAMPCNCVWHIASGWNQPAMWSKRIMYGPGVVVNCLCTLCYPIIIIMQTYLIDALQTMDRNYPQKHSV